MEKRSLVFPMSVAVMVGVASAALHGQPVRIADSLRAMKLYVSVDPKDHAQSDHERDRNRKVLIDSVYRARSIGVMDFQKIVFPSTDGLPIPAYLFQPPTKRGHLGHAAMVWVHGGVHGDWDATMLPFVVEAVNRGYVVIAPEYRGSTGYGATHYNAIDYGGREIDDILAAARFLRTLPHVDASRLGIMGWSHGGYIAALLLFRSSQPFKGGAAMVPVTNLVFRLSYKGPAYARAFATQKGIGGLPHERRTEYISRSPLYWVDSLQVPILVHVATNDIDVDFVESEMLISALRVKKPELAETRVYLDPIGGHSFNRLVDASTLERRDTPEQRDSWNRVWVFFDWLLRPYEDPSTSVVPPATSP